MSADEQAPIVEPTAETNAEQTAEPQGGEQKTFDADYVSKLRAENAKYRTAAKANEDAAKRLAEIEESQKSDAEKAAERLAAAEKRASEAEAKALRTEVATAKGVPAELLNGATHEELEAHADQLLAFRGEAPKRPAAPPATGQGNVGSVPAGPVQRTRADLKTMTPEQIETARQNGELRDLMAGKS